MRNKIFNQIRVNKMSAGHLWRFQQYHGAFAVNMSKSERKEFYDTISDLCNEGIFEIVPNGTVNNLRLTELGEKTIYSL